MTIKKYGHGLPMCGMWNHVLSGLGVWSWRGALHSRTELGLTKADRKLMVVNTIEMAVQIAEVFARKRAVWDGTKLTLWVGKNYAHLIEYEGRDYIKRQCRTIVLNRKSHWRSTSHLIKKSSRGVFWYVICNVFRVHKYQFWYWTYTD